MVDQISVSDLLDTRVEAVMRNVGRHLSLPEAVVEDAYADQAVITKLDSDGRPLSCSSQPTVVAMTLDSSTPDTATGSSRSVPAPGTTQRSGLGIEAGIDLM